LNLNALKIKKSVKQQFLDKKLIAKESLAILEKLRNFQE